MLKQLPFELELLIKDYEDFLNESILNSLSPKSRFALYKAFGSSSHPGSVKDLVKKVQTERVHLILTEADRAFGWLAVITAKKVLPTWESIVHKEVQQLSTYSKNLVFIMLSQAESVLLGKVDAFTVFEKALHDEYYLGVANIEFNTNEKALWACYAVYDALCAIFLGTSALSHSLCINTEDQDTRRPRCHDFAKMAVRAYSSIDENQMLSRRRLEKIGQYKEVSFDPQKRRDFWKWWLNEAIPQAWELAQQSS